MKFIETNSNKVPVTKLEEQFYSDSVEQLNNAGLIIGNDIVVLDFDGDNVNEEQIMNYIDTNYPTLCVTTSRGKHYYYSMPNDYQFKRRTDSISVIGFQCDYLTGKKAYAIVKQNGEIRKMNKPLSLDNLPILPECFYPLTKVKYNLSGLENGDGRNNKLFYHLHCVKEEYPDVDLNKIANIINTVIFKEGLPKNELKSLTNSVAKSSISDFKNNNKIRKLDYSSIKELQDKNLPDIVFYVDKLLPQGLNIICSVPKIGKSWMAIDLCLSIATGTPFLGFKTSKAGCLYLALEDSENRLQGRVNKLVNGGIIPDNFFYAIISNDLADGLIEQLESFIKEKPNVKIIIIDTLQKIRGEYKGNSYYANDYNEVGKIKQFGDEHGLCIILIHHLRKGLANGDVFERISGTNGIMGAVDTALTLSKNNRSDVETYLSVTGRDVDFNEYVLEFEKEACKWKFVRTAEEQKDQDEVAEYLNSTLIRTIKVLIKENNGKWAGTFKKLVSTQKEMFEEGKNEMTASNEVKRFAKLLESIDGIIFTPAKYPEKGVRIQTFTKQTVDSVEA